MKILILGASGFVGRNVYEYISKKYDNVYAPTHKELDTLDKTSIDSYFRDNSFFDIIIYCVCIYDTILFKNIVSFFNIATKEDCYGKMIYFGSWAEYDRRYWGANIKEEDFGKHVPVDEYGFSKYLINKYILDNENNKIVNLRLFGLVGKYNTEKKRLLPSIYSQAPNLIVILEEEQTMDLLYAGDIGEIVDRFIKNGFGEYREYNVCTGRCELYSNVLDKVNSLFGNRLTPFLNGKTNIEARFGNNERLLNHIGDFEFTDIDEAIKLSHEWNREYHGKAN